MYNKKQIIDGANWLRGKGTFHVMCSREVRALVTISQKGGISEL